VIGVASGAAIKTTSGAAVEIANRIGGAAGGGVKDDCVASKEL
jgi:hypothetical protein